MGTSGGARASQPARRRDLFRWLGHGPRPGKVLVRQELLGRVLGGDGLISRQVRSAEGRGGLHLAHVNTFQRFIRESLPACAGDVIRREHRPTNRRQGCRTPVHKCLSRHLCGIFFLTHRSCAAPTLRFVMFWLLQLSGRRPVQWLLQKAFTATDQGLPVSCWQVCWDYQDKLAQVFSSAPRKSAFSPLVWASGWRPLALPAAQPRLQGGG